MNYLLKRIRSFKVAGIGVAKLIAGEDHAKIHLGAAIAAIALAAILKCTSMEWIAIILCIGGVFCAEAMNTAVEKVCDKVTRESDPLIGASKDIAAGGVLIIAAAALAVGLIIFIPKIFF